MVVLLHGELDGVPAVVRESLVEQLVELPALELVGVLLNGKLAGELATELEEELTE